MPLNEMSPVQSKRITVTVARVIMCGIILAGMAMIGSAYRSYAAVHKLVPLKGVVVSDSDPLSGKKTRICVPLVSYVASDGKPRTWTANYGNHCMFSVGQSIDLAYDPQYPDSVTGASDASFQIVFMVIGSIWVAIGVGGAIKPSIIRVGGVPLV